MQTAFADHVRHSALEMGYCCGLAYRGGDCGCGGPNPADRPSAEEMRAMGYVLVGDAWVGTSAPLPATEPALDDDVPF